MKTVTDKPEHQPSESHTLDEVLRSLQDLIHGELLDAEPKPPPPPKIHHGKVGRPRKPRPEPAAAPAANAEGPVDIESVMRSLKALVSDELADVDESATEPAPETEPADAGITAAAAPAEPEPARPAEPGAAVPPPPAGAQQELLLDAPATPELVPDAPTQTAEDIIHELESMVHEEARHHALAVPETTNPSADANATPGLELPEELILDSLLPDDGATLTLDDFATPAPRTAAKPEPMPAPERADPLTVDFESSAEIIGTDFLAGPDPGQEPELIDMLPDTTPPADATADAKPPVPAPVATALDDFVLDEELTLDALPGSPEPAPTPMPAPGTVAEFELDFREEPAAPDLAADESLAPPSSAEPEIEIAEQPLGVVETGDVPVLGESVNFDDLPVLSDVVVPAPELELAPPETRKTAELPFGPPEQVRQLAIRVVAKLNIELRKAGERPLAARTIDRLQYVLGEEIERLSREPGRK